MLKEIEQKFIKEVQVCENCRKEEMKPTGIAYLTNPPTYQFKCSNCGTFKEY